jgi:hypothetical protein
VTEANVSLLLCTLGETTYTVETEGSGDRGDNLGNDSVEVGEAGLRNTKVLLANVVNGFVVNLLGVKKNDIRDKPKIRP